MNTVFLRLCGPMQAWGTTGKFDIRNTEPWPTKSGVLGLIAAAMGIDRHGDISDISSLRMGVSVLSPGDIHVDYQTAEIPSIKTIDILSWHSNSGVDTKKKETAISCRYYLTDADFLVGLAGDDAIVSKVINAIKDPVWSPFLGRKSYVPSLPIAVNNGISTGNLASDILHTSADILLAESKGSDTILSSDITLVIESSEEDATTFVPDQPISTFAKRLYTKRPIRISVESLINYGIQHETHL